MSSDFQIDLLLAVADRLKTAEHNIRSYEKMLAGRYLNAAGAPAAQAHIDLQKGFKQRCLDQMRHLLKEAS